MDGCIGVVQFVLILTLRPFVLALQSSSVGAEDGFLFSLIGNACDANDSICADSDAVASGL